MKTSRFTDSQIIAILKQAEAGSPRAGTVPRTRHQQCHVLQVAREMAQWAVTERSATIGLACQAFGISQTRYRYRAKLNAENHVIADWLGTADEQPAQLGLRAVLPVPAQCKGLQMEPQARLQDLPRARTE